MIMEENSKIIFYFYIALILNLFSSLFLSQTNEACESVHKEIRKYILTQFTNKKKFNIKNILLSH